MELLNQIFGVGKDLSVTQMCARGAVVFFITLILLRISGRRSFGLKSPLDLIISILLGSILSRGIVGVSPFVPVLGCCLLIVVLHRLFSWVSIRHKWFRRLTEGKAILLFKDGEFMQDSLNKALVNQEDILPQVRKDIASEDLEKVEKIYMERTGEITLTKRP